VQRKSVGQDAVDDVRCKDDVIFTQDIAPVQTRGHRRSRALASGERPLQLTLVQGPVHLDEPVWQTKQTDTALCIVAEPV